MQRFSCIVIVILIAVTAGCAKKSDINAAILALTGEVTVNGAAVPGPGRAIVYGDIIVTGPNATCEIIVNDNSIFRLGKGTTLRFLLKADSGELALDAGWFAGISRKLFKREATYLVKTPTVTASIRGTSYCIKVEKPGSTYFCVCNGIIALAGEGEKPESVSSPHHTARRFSRDAAGKLSVDANPGLLYHDDAGLETLAKKVGAVIDWSKADSH